MPRQPRQLCLTPALHIIRALVPDAVDIEHQGERHLSPVGPVLVARKKGSRGVNLATFDLGDLRPPVKALYAKPTEL